MSKKHHLGNTNNDKLKHPVITVKSKYIFVSFILHPFVLRVYLIPTLMF